MFIPAQMTGICYQIFQVQPGDPICANSPGSRTMYPFYSRNRSSEFAEIRAVILLIFEPTVRASFRLAS